MKPIALREVTMQVAPLTRRALVVVGMHRSGTSAMARTLSLLGAALPKRLMEASDSNSAGHWEPQSIADLNEEILQALDSEWDDVFAFRPRPYLSNFDRVYVGRAVDLLEQEFDGSEIIVLKDPRVSVLTVFWERALSEAGYHSHYVTMVRNPLEVAGSLRDRNSFPREKSLLLWSGYMCAVERDTRELPRTFISYDELMRDWRNVQRRVEDGAGFPFPRDTATAALEIDRFLNARLRHHEIPQEEVLKSTDIPDHVKTLYRAFLEACEGADIDKAAIDAVRAELGEVERQIGPLMADLKARTTSLIHEVERLNSAQASARGEIDTIVHQLETERGSLNEQLAETERLRGELSLRENELSKRQEEIDQTRSELDAIRAVLSESERRLEEASAQKVVAEALLASSKELCNHEQARADKLVAELEEVRAQKATAEARVDDRSGEIVALTRELRKKQGEIAEGSEMLIKVKSELGAALENARAEKERAEARVEERFREIATLSKLLAERETLERTSREQIAWLRGIGAALASSPTSLKGRLLALLPAAFQRKRQQRLLRRKGLFDGDAYLAAHPDVAKHGADPLRHYLQHGISENRRRA